MLSLENINSHTCRERSVPVGVDGPKDFHMIRVFVMDSIGSESKRNDEREEIMSEQSVSLQEPTIFSQNS